MLLLNYLLCSFKRSLKFLPFAVILSLIIAVMLGSLLLNSFSHDESGEIQYNSKVGIGLTGDLDDKYLNMGLGAVRALDYSKNYLDIKFFENEELAASAIEKGEIFGYLILPENFISSVLNGSNTPATFVCSNSQVDLIPTIADDLIKTVSNLVVESQVGIFAMDNIYKDYELTGRKRVLNEINLKYINFVISRDDMVEVTEIGSSGETTVMGYYFCAFCILIVILTGILCSGFCVKKNLSLSRLLSVSGLRPSLQILCEFASFLLLPVFSIFVLFLLLPLFAENGGAINISELGGLSFVDYMRMFLHLIPSFVLICSLQFFVYELCGNVLAATVVQFIVSVGLAYISGCIYPITFFPDPLVKVSSVLPFGVSFNYFKHVFVGYFDTEGLLFCIAYCALFVIAAFLVRNVKVRSNLS